MLALLTLVLLLTVSQQVEMKILRLPDGENSVTGPRPAPCALTCSGTEEIDNWTDGSGGKARIHVDYGECGFVSTPIVTVSVESWTPARCPPVIVETYRSTEKFYAEAALPRTGSQMIADQCRVNWSAYGFNC